MANIQEQELALFKRLAAAANGAPTEAVAGAAANLLINAIVQLHPSSDEAKKAFAKIELLMLQRYDVSGRPNILVPAREVLRV